MASLSSSPSMAAVILLLWMIMAILGLAGAQSIGVCYGGLGSNLPPPREVVDLYKSNNIGRMRIYYPDQVTLQALGGSNIELIHGVPNTDLQSIASGVSGASDWIQRNVRNHPDVNFKYIAVGNEVSPDDENSQFVSYVLPALQNMYTAIQSAGLQGRIKVTTAVDTRLIYQTYPPSNGSFRPEIQSYFNPILDFLLKNQVPILVNVYPYFSYINTPGMKIEYALFTSPSVEVQDGQFGYQNLFDAIVDAFYSALEKAGASNLEIVVSESGWPSAGGSATVTTVENARLYNQNLIHHVGKGTPKRPGRPVETYIFAMFNEDQKNPEFERHWGLFYPNKEPVYPINFS